MAEHRSTVALQEAVYRFRTLLAHWYRMRSTSDEIIEVAQEIDCAIADISRSGETTEEFKPPMVEEEAPDCRFLMRMKFTHLLWGP
jgi:hypothetical protein